MAEQIEVLFGVETLGEHKTAADFPSRFDGAFAKLHVSLVLLVKLFSPLVITKFFYKHWLLYRLK